MSTGDHAVPELAKSLNLDFDHVSRRHPPLLGHTEDDPFRRTGDDHVTRLEREMAADVGDDLRHREDHVIGVRVLAQIAIQPSADGEFLRIRYLFGGHRYGP